MASSANNDDFPFLDTDRDNLTADEFLKQRLSFLLEYYSYEELSGLSVEEINRQAREYNRDLKKIQSHFHNDSSIWENNKPFAEFILDKRLYDPLNQEQIAEINRVTNQINRNLERANQDAQDRRFERLRDILSSLPGLN